MRAAVAVVLAGLVLTAACSKKPAAAPAAAATPPTPTAGPAAPVSASPAPTTPTAAGPEVSGTYAGNGKPSTLTQVTAHVGDPFDGKPITVLVFTAKDQGGDPKADFHAVFGNFGDAIVVRTEADGTVVGADVVHGGLKSPGGSISISGPIVLKDYRTSGGQISGHLTSGGPVDVFDQKVEIDLTFHTKAP